MTDQLGERLPLDVVHGVEVDGPLAADKVNLHDIGMPQRSGRPGLVLEPLKLFLIEHCRKGQDLQRHLAAQRDLLRLVDDPHPAPADLAHDAIVAEDAGPQLRGLRRFRRSGK